jgi:hypothetical protein
MVSDNPTCEWCGDIVTRLRELAVKQDAKWSDPTDAPLTMYQVAADEIERLRKEWSIWKMTAEHLARELGKVEYAEATYDDVCRAVRGD